MRIVSMPDWVFEKLPKVLSTSEWVVYTQLYSLSQAVNRETIRIGYGRLAKRCGLSKTPTIEALHGLESRGFIERLDTNHVGTLIKVNLSEPVVESNRDDPGCVYVIGSDVGFYKIGKAKDVNQRMMQLNRSDLPFKLHLIHTIKCRDYTATENYLHTRFAHRRVGGEWFKLNGSDIEFIKALEID